MARAERITATILGCGSSGGVPRIGNIWGACDPAEPRNRRRRCALLISGTRSDSDQPTNVLIDTGPDLREQMLDAGVTALHAVLYTHEHADHTHGIDDLRVFALNNRERVDVYFSADAGQRIKAAFGYCFSTPIGSPYPPILNAHEIAAGDVLTVEGPGGSIDITAFAQEHGGIFSLGYRVGGFAYSCDLSGIPEASAGMVSDLDVWVLDALRITPHPSHLSLSEALELVERYRTRQVVLTNLHTDMDYGATDRATPDHVRPAFDGLMIDVTAGKVLA